jgi:tetratricopeptide (TPR) repeat protein
MAFEAGDYERSLEAANRALALDPQNSEALNCAGRSRKQMDDARIRTLIDVYVQSLGAGTLLPFYENHCSQELYQALKGDIELISRAYAEFKSIASDVAIQFKDADTAEASFSNITTGTPTGQTQSRVIFEGSYLWTIQRRGDDWKIIQIRALPARVK